MRTTRILLALLLVTLLVTGCINVTVTVPTPVVPAEATAKPATTREPTLQIIEPENGQIIPEPALYKYKITIKGKVIDNVTREEVKNAKAVFITETGTHIFGSRYKFTMPSGSVLRFVITAPGYEKVDKLFKPRLLRNATIDMDITIGKEKGRIG